MNKLKHNTEEWYNLQRPGREEPLTIKDGKSPVLETLCSHKFITCLIMANRELLHIGQASTAGEAEVGLCGSSVLRPCPGSQAFVLELSMQYPEKGVIYPLFTNPHPDLARFSWLLYGNTSHQILMKKIILVELA